ncbi:MAG: hypothetical protein RLZZ618_3165 [Pseudomonadota bacterium]
MTVNSHLPEIEAAVDQLLAEQRHNDALANILVGVHNHYKSPAAQNQLYYPVFDRQMTALAAALEAACGLESATPAPLTDNTLIVASELYQVGGHSRVIEDCVRELKSVTLVLTDVFSSYRKQPAHLNWVMDTYENISLIVLPQLSVWAKCKALRLLTQRLNPRSILYFNHHQDPIGLVGTMQHPGSRKAFIHHADHNPSLGCTLPGMVHADFTDELPAICSRELHTHAPVLPLYAPDAGRKTFSPVEPDAYSVVTSGTQIKFTRDGEFALHLIVATVLQATRGQFIHIGPLADDWLIEIRGHLETQGIDPLRFVPLGSVPSLWQTLLTIDAHVYLGSAPVGGGRAAIEAQGCGYPLVFFRIGDRQALTAIDSVYATPSSNWSSLQELQQLLSRMGSRLEQLGDEARAFYEQRFSHARFVQVLNELVN